MGAPVVATVRLRVTPDAARQFAQEYDASPVHVGGAANPLLPAGTASGVYLLAVVNREVTELVRPLAAASMSVEWRMPWDPRRPTEARIVSTELRPGVVSTVASVRYSGHDESVAVIRYDQRVARDT